MKVKRGGFGLARAEGFEAGQAVLDGAGTVLLRGPGQVAPYQSLDLCLRPAGHNHGAALGVNLLTGAGPDAVHAQA